MFLHLRAPRPGSCRGTEARSLRTSDLDASLVSARLLITCSCSLPSITLRNAMCGSKIIPRAEMIHPSKTRTARPKHPASRPCVEVGHWSLGPRDKLYMYIHRGHRRAFLHLLFDHGSVNRRTPRRSDPQLQQASSFPILARQFKKASQSETFPSH